MNGWALVGQILVLVAMILWIAWALYLQRKLYEVRWEFEDFRRARYFTAIRTFREANPEKDLSEVRFQIGVYRFENSGSGYHTK